MRQQNKFCSFLIFLGLYTQLSWGVESYRGRLLNAQKMESWGWSQKAINLAKAQMKISTAHFPTRSRVDIYRIRFETLDHKQKFISSSGIVLVPTEISTPLPLMSYQHATRIGPKEAASVQRFDPEAQMMAILFASDCCLVSMPDYLGLGIEAQGPQFYLNAEIQAITGVDMLKAAQSFFTEKGIAYTKNLFLAGYSQGAHNTLAMHKYLQQVEKSGPRILATSGMSGPYDLTTMARNLFKFDPNVRIDPVFLALAIFGMHEAYDFFPRFTDILAEPYSSTLPAALKKANFREISKQLPKNVRELFNMGYVLGVVTGGPQHPFWKALTLNDVHNFIPNAPLLIVHSPTDNVVPFSSAENAVKKMNEAGAKIEFKVLDKKWNDHTQAAFPALLETHRFFKSINN